MKLWTLAIWSVLAFLLLSTDAFASKNLFLNQVDSTALIERMKQPLLKENYRNNDFYMKRFKTSDGAVRVDCGKHRRPRQGYSTMCSVTLDPAKSATGVTQITPGEALMPMTFKILAKADVAYMLENMVLGKGPFYSSATILISSDKIKNMRVPRFYFNCPRDWVFDVVYCEGHIIAR